MPTEYDISSFPVIASRQNSLVKQLRAAFAANGSHNGASIGRKAGEARGLVAIEGEHMLHEALRSGLELETVFVQDGRQALLRGLPLPPSTRVAALSEDAFHSAVATETPQGIAALLKPPQFARENLLGNGETKGANPLILIAAGLQDPGNMGTLVRSAEAFGATGVLALPGTVSAWNQKALRASAGSTLRLPIVAGAIDDLRWLRSMGVRLLAATMQGAAAAETDMRGAAALLIGNEGAGLSLELLALADARIAIPCPGPVESLNAAIAGSLLLYEAARQRSTQGATARIRANAVAPTSSDASESR